MLVSHLMTVDQNDYLSSRMEAAFAFLREADLDNLPLGRNEIDGDAVFANVQEYETVPACEKQMEAHRCYYDVQYMVSGEEVLEYTPLVGLVEATPFDEASDFGLYATPELCSRVVLREGDLAILAPEDAHKPGCSLKGAIPVRKIVVKVLSLV